MQSKQWHALRCWMILKWMHELYEIENWIKDFDSPVKRQHCLTSLACVLGLQIFTGPWTPVAKYRRHGFDSTRGLSVTAWKEMRMTCG